MAQVTLPRDQRRSYFQVQMAIQDICSFAAWNASERRIEIVHVL